MNNPVNVHTKANAELVTLQDVKTIRDDVAGVRGDTAKHAITLGRMDERLKTVEDKVHKTSEKQGEMDGALIRVNMIIKFAIGGLVLVVIPVAVKYLFN